VAGFDAFGDIIQKRIPQQLTTVENQKYVLNRKSIHSRKDIFVINVQPIEY
jgi:ABC-type transporter MlaC component